MTLDVKKTLERLSSLQVIDSKINKSTILIKEIPLEWEDISIKASEYEEKIFLIQNSIKEHEDKIEKEKNNIEVNTNQLEASKHQLKSIKQDTMEYFDLSEEIEVNDLEIQISNKKISESKKEISSLEDDHKIINKLLDELKNSMGKKELELKKIIDEKNKEVKNLEIERKKIIKEIDEKILERYEKIRKSTFIGFGVSEVERGACGACFMFIPIQQRVDISLYEEIQTCPYCGVFIVSTTLNNISEEGYSAKFNPYEHESMLESVDSKM